MKTLHLSIIVFLLTLMLFPFNTILAQNQTQPTIEFDQASYATSGMSCNPYQQKITTQAVEQNKVTIIVTDPNANKFSTSIDRVVVFVWSDSDRKGIEITAYETEVNSGIFKGKITISEGQSTQDIIHVRNGDTLSARYAGTTPGSFDTTSHGITTTSFIGISCPPLERVPASSIRILDIKGNEHNVTTVGKQVLIVSDISNPTPVNQNFTYIVQIQDKNGSTASLAWLSGIMLPNQTSSPSVSWTPSKTGNYVVQIFVWQSLTNPNALSPPLVTDLTVLHDLAIYPRSIDNAENLHCQQDLQLVIKAEDGSPACVKPDTATKLELRGWAYQDILSKNKPYEGFTSTNTNQTLIIGTDVYDVREFSPVAGNTIYLDDMKFVYEGRSPLNNSCYPELVNQTQAKDFEIVSNETDMHAHYCWPPTNYPQNMTKQNVFPHDLFSRYSIGFFDNQTMGIGWCHLDSCEFGKMFYLVKKGWNTPIVYDSPSNLEFHLATNASVISSVQAIGIDMSTSNKLSNTIMVPNKYDFSFEGTGLGPCYYGPFRLGIFKGYFDENNFTKGTELKMYQPGMYSCAAPSPAKGYKFEPKSETSTPRCSPFEYCAWIEQMQDHVFFSGYWEDTKFHKFESGTYTIIAGDEWRNHSIKHFTVSQNG